MKKLTLALALLLGGCASHSTALNTEPSSSARFSSKITNKVDPTYPLAAFLSELEGYVQFIFDIDEQGVPQNIRVTKSVPEGVFDSSALRALEQWRFMPRVIDGQAVVQPEQTVQLDFTLNLLSTQKENQANRPTNEGKGNQTLINKPLMITNQNALRVLFQSLELQRKSQNSEAISLLLEAVHNSTFQTPFEQAVSQHILGNFYAKNGDMDAAISYLSSACASYLLPSNSQANCLKILADIHLQQGHFQAAIDSYRQWLAFTGEQNPEVLQRIALAEQRLARQ